MDPLLAGLIGVAVAISSNLSYEKGKKEIVEKPKIEQASTVTPDANTEAVDVPK